MKRIIVILSTVVLSLLINNAYAHVGIQVKNININVGWLNEPPLVNELNYVTFKFTKDNVPLVIDPSTLQISIRYGGVTKPLELQQLDEVGKYGAPIIPTRTGNYIVVIKGTIEGNQVNSEAPLEDVEDKGRLNFPAETGSNIDINMITSQLQSSLTQLNLKVEQANRMAEESKNVTQITLNTVKDIQKDFYRVYSFGMLGMGLGAAGIIIGIISLIRKNKGES